MDKYMENLFDRNFCRRLAVLIGAGLLVGSFAGFIGVSPATADDDAELAKQLSNPVAALISVPFQGNYDSGIGPLDEGDKFYVNIQPVIPITLNEEWNLISRTILPVVKQNDILPLSGEQFGISDTLQSFFLSPAAPTPEGIVWGLGPVVLAPTGTDEYLSGEKWGAGPTGVILKQSGRWTIGALANHVWSFAGDPDRADINSTYVQPFLSYTTPDLWTFTLNTESTYNWNTEEWSVPINLVASKLVKFGEQRVSLFAGVRYWADTPDLTGPQDVGFRFGATFLFPKK